MAEQTGMSVTGFRGLIGTFLARVGDVSSEGLEVIRLLQVVYFQGGMPILGFIRGVRVVLEQQQLLHLWGDFCSFLPEGYRSDDLSRLLRGLPSQVEVRANAEEILQQLNRPRAPRPRPAPPAQPRPLPPAMASQQRTIPTRPAAHRHPAIRVPDLASYIAAQRARSTTTPPPSTQLVRLATPRHTTVLGTLPGSRIPRPSPLSHAISTLSLGRLTRSIHAHTTLRAAGPAATARVWTGVTSMRPRPVGVRPASQHAPATPRQPPPTATPPAPRRPGVASSGRITSRDGTTLRLPSVGRPRGRGGMNAPARRPSGLRNVAFPRSEAEESESESDDEASVTGKTGEDVEVRVVEDGDGDGDVFGD